MVTSYAEANVAKKSGGGSPAPPEGKKPAPTPTKIDGELAAKLAIVCKYRRQPAHVLLDPLIRDWIEAEYAVSIRALAKELDSPAGRG